MSAEVVTVGVPWAVKGLFYTAVARQAEATAVEVVRYAKADETDAGRRCAEARDRLTATCALQLNQASQLRPEGELLFRGDREALKGTLRAFASEVVAPLLSGAVACDDSSEARARLALLTDAIDWALGAGVELDSGAEEAGRA